MAYIEYKTAMGIRYQTKQNAYTYEPEQSLVDQVAKLKNKNGTYNSSNQSKAARAISRLSNSLTRILSSMDEESV